MRLNKDFLTNYNDTLLKTIFPDGGFVMFKKLVESKSYKSFTNYDYQTTYDYLLNVKLILDKITTIAFNPHINATTEEVIVRSELASKLSIDSFKQTIKDSKLWSHKNNEMSPQYVHTTQYIDTFVTYENTFIAMLIDYICDDVEEIISNITPLVKSIEQEYETKGVSYGKYSLLNEFENTGLPLNKDFLIEKVTSKEVISLAHRLIKRIKNLKAMEYYRFNHQNKIDKNIQPTNILIHDQLYSNCYRFYLANYVISDSSYYLKKNISYYNYVILNLLAYLKDDINDIKFRLDNNRIIFDKFIFSKGMFTYQVSSDDLNLGFEIDVTLKVSETETSKAKYYLLTSLKYDEASQPRIDALIKDKLLSYDDVILICQNNLLGQFNNLLNISIYQDFNHILYKNLFNSLSMIFDASKDVYENICPVCGETHPIIEGEDYVCNSCHAKYQILNKNKKPLLWIKSLRRE